MNPLDRWEFNIVCRDCGSTFEVLKPDISCQRASKFGRLVLLHIPEVCPECRNLKLVKGSGHE